MPAFDFNACLDALGPFERPPSIAAAVSGGSDSLALGLLLAEWVNARGGRLHVLSVDHGLRPEARAECVFVARRFAMLPGCAAQILEWTGSKPASGLQQAARDARYRLLTEWCRDRGVLHLAVGHTADDQAETVAMRRAHGSSAIGLAAMPAVSTWDGVRLLRPLLGRWRSDLRDWLTERGERWIEDPSNLAAEFERVRQRQALAQSNTAATLVGEAMRFGQARDTEDRAVARLLAVAATWHPEAYLTVDLGAWERANLALRRAALRRMVLTVGGHRHSPSPDQLARFASTPLAGTIGTLAGCVLSVRRGRLMLCREVGDIRDERLVAPGWRGPWDQRFALEVVAHPPVPHTGGRLSIRALGVAGQHQAARRFGLSLKRHPVPEPARAALPALWNDGQLIAQPHLGLGQGLTARAAPRHSVTTCGFTVALCPPHTIYSSVPG